MLFYTDRLTKALQERFTNEDEIIDVANYGCSIGVSGFTYYKETTKFFEEFEDDIEDVCFDTLGDDFMAILSKDITSVQGLIQVMVWHTVETYCQRIVDILEESEAA